MIELTYKMIKLFFYINHIRSSMIRTRILEDLIFLPYNFSNTIVAWIRSPPKKPPLVADAVGDGM